MKDTNSKSVDSKSLRNEIRDKITAAGELDRLLFSYGV